jgi:predicted nucleic acid-binding protein
VILADTSAWVEYDRATGSAVDRRLSELIATGGPVAVTEPVTMEVLAGARSDDRESDLRRLLLRFALLRFDAVADFDGAVRIYRRCRRAGVTPRGMVDCMIAAVASRSGATLLAYDADMDRLARVVGIDLDEASLRSEIVREAIDEKLDRPDDSELFEAALSRASGIWASRDDIGSTDEYIRRLRRDRRGSKAP